MVYEVGLLPYWKVYPTFHLSKLKRYHRFDEFLKEVESPPLVLVEDILEYEVKSIAQNRGMGAHRQHLVIVTKCIKH